MDSLKDCRLGKHPFQRILTTRNDGFDTYSVVRWCPICGAIVVDSETDGRTYPGQVVSMRLPLLVCNIIDQERKDREIVDDFET